MALELEGLIARLLLVISCAGEQGMGFLASHYFAFVTKIKNLVLAR